MEMEVRGRTSLSREFKAGRGGLTEILKFGQGENLCHMPVQFNLHSSSFG